MSDIYIGSPAFDPKPYTRVDPLAVADAGMWRTGRKWPAVFPSEGKVFAPHLNGFCKGELISFDVEANRRGDDRPDQFLVNNPQHVIEVLDFRSIDEEGARRKLVEYGIVDVLKDSASIVAVIGNDKCVVLNLVHHPATLRHVANASGLEDLAVHMFDRRLFKGDKILDRWIAVPGVTVGKEIERVNWCRDADFLESVLKRLRRTLQGSGAITRNQIAQVVGLLERAELMPANGADLRPILQRLKSFKREFAAKADVLAEILEVISSFNSVEEALKADLKERRDILEKEIRTSIETKVISDLDAKTHGLRAEKSSLESEVRDLSAKAGALRGDITALEAEIAGARSAMTKELLSVVTKFSELSEDEVPSIEPLVEKLCSFTRENARELAVLSRPCPPWSRVRTHEVHAADWAIIGKLMENAAKRCSFSSVDLIAADIAARSGLFVVLPEGDAEFVQCYADALAGGRLVRHALDPMTIGLDDLWSKPSNSSPTALARAWSGASLQPDEFHIVLLDGVHRTPFDLWLPSFVEVLATERRPRNLLVFGTLGTEFVDGNRVWKNLHNSSFAIRPERFLNQTTEAVLALTKKSIEITSLDPRTMPQAELEELLEVMDRSNAMTEKIDQTRLLKVFTTAWPYKELVDPFGYSVALAGSSELADQEVARRRADGARWLGEVLETAR